MLFRPQCSLPHSGSLNGPCSLSASFCDGKAGGRLTGSPTLHVYPIVTVTKTESAVVAQRRFGI